MTTPRYALIIPTRNRQVYAVSAVESVIAAAAGRDDVEIIVADCSDDGDVIAVRLAEAGLLKRVTLLEAPERRLSMRENWERAVAAASATYLTVIGDDDAVLPWAFDAWDALSTAIDTPMFAWRWVDYHWPCHPARVAGRLTAPMGKVELQAVKSSAMLAQHAQWRTTSRWPALGPSLYHGLVKRDLVDRTRDLYGSAFLSFVVDYSSSITNLALTKGFVFFTGALTIQGACGSSNSAGTSGAQAARDRLADLMAENPGLPALPEGLDETQLHAPRVALGYGQIFGALGANFSIELDKLLTSCVAEMRGLDDPDDFEREKALLVAFAHRHGLNAARVEAETHPEPGHMVGYDATTERLWVDALAVGWRTAAQAAAGVGAVMQNPAARKDELHAAASDAAGKMKVWTALQAQLSAARSTEAESASPEPVA